MRERFEAFAARGIAVRIGFVLLGLVVAWMVAGPALDKRWYESAIDALPYFFIAIVMFRTPGTLRAIGERMRAYEREKGEDPEIELDDGGAAEEAL